MNQEDNERKREREQRAPRLQTTSPLLTGLMLEISEYSKIACTKYKKRFHVPSAPAWFELRCNDEHCQHGGYDLTPMILRALRASETRSRGDMHCEGSTGTAECGRHLHYELFAEYRAAP